METSVGKTSPDVVLRESCYFSEILSASLLLPDWRSEVVGEEGGDGREWPQAAGLVPGPPCRVHSVSELVWGWSLMVRSPTAPSPPLPLLLHFREEVFPGET